MAAVRPRTAGTGRWTWRRRVELNCHQSHSPRTLPELLRAPHAAPAVNIVGHLFLPPGNAPVPAVVFMHGSGGLYDAMLGYWPQLLNAQGIAVLPLDTFGPRGVRSTAEDQSQVPFSADVEDVFSALRLLATHPRIQASRIAVLGTSRGGLAAWRSNVEKIIAAQQLPGGLRFAAHVQLYAGGCVGAFRLVVRPGVFGPAPMLWVHGDADDYTPIGPCRDYAEHIDQAGTRATFVTLPGARQTGRCTGEKPPTEGVAKRAEATPQGGSTVLL